MDIDTFVEVHQPQWDRLAQLSGRGTRLSGAEAGEVVDLYQRVSSHLAMVRTSAYDPELEARLSALVTNARAVITGTRPALLRSFVRFVTVTLPAAFFRLRWWALAALGLLVLIAGIVAARVILDPELAAQKLGAARIEQYVNYDFEHYYSAHPANAFAAEVWLNNCRVAAMMVLLGITVIPAVVLFIANAASLGMAAGMLIGHGRGDVFFGLILPHGMLELTCLAFAFAAGVRMFWAWVAPGRRTRSRALAEEGRTLGTVVVGLVVFLAMAGLLEAFLTPSGWSATARVGLGFVVWLAVMVYVVALGWRAERAGVTGDVDADQRSATQPIEVEL